MRPSARTEAHSATYGSAFIELSRNCFALRFLEGHHLEGTPSLAHPSRIAIP